MAKKTSVKGGPVIESLPSYAPILVNLTGLIFVVSQESGVLLQSIDRTTSNTREDVFDVSQAVDIGFVGYNPQASWTIKGRVNALNTGLTAAAPSVAIALNNDTGVWTGNGVSAGGIYCETVAVSYTEKQFVEISVTAMQKPAIA